jgi:hypothetical protein
MPADQVASRLGVDISHVRRLTSRGRLSVVVPTRRLVSPAMYDRRQVEEYAAARERRKTPQPPPKPANAAALAAAARRELLAGRGCGEFARIAAESAARRGGMPGEVAWWEMAPLSELAARRSPGGAVEASSRWRYISPDDAWRLDAEGSGFWTVTCAGLGLVAQGRVTMPVAYQMATALALIAALQSRVEAIL